MAATKKSSGGRRYSRKAGSKVKRAMHEKKQGTLKSGRGGKKVTSRKQAIAIGLSEARREGAKVPKKSAKTSSSPRSHRSSARSAAAKRPGGRSGAHRSSGPGARRRRRSSSRSR
jgi:hypothetical protein